MKKTIAAILMVSVSSQMGWATQSSQESRNVFSQNLSSSVPNAVSSSHNATSYMEILSGPKNFFLPSAALFSIATFNPEQTKDWVAGIDGFLALGGTGLVLLPFFYGKGEESSLASLQRSLAQVGYHTVESPVAVRNFLNSVKDPGAVALVLMSSLVKGLDHMIKVTVRDFLYDVMLPVGTVSGKASHLVVCKIYTVADGVSSVAMFWQPRVEWGTFRKTHDSSSASFMAKAGASMGFLQPLRFPLWLLSHSSLGGLAPTAAAFRYEASLFAPLKIQLAHEMLSPYNQISLLPEEASSFVQTLTQAHGEEILPALPFGVAAGAVVGALSFTLGGPVTIEPLVGALIASGNSRFAERVLVGGASTEVMRIAVGRSSLTQMLYNILRNTDPAALATRGASANVAVSGAAGAAGAQPRSYFSALKSAALALPAALGQTMHRAPRAVLAVGATTLLSVVSAATMSEGWAISQVTAGAVPVVATALFALGGHLISGLQK